MSSTRSAAALVLGGVVSVQCGSALATTLFDQAGPGGTVFLRCAFAALVLVLLWRPVWRGHRGQPLRDVALFGLVLAAMNLSFYASLERIPLGIAVTLEFVGPLGVAVWRSPSRLDLLWVAFAAAGLLLLAPIGDSSLDALGVVLALFAGTCWGAYILLSARVGRSFAGGSGLAIAMSLSALVLVPVGILDGGSALLDGEVLLAGAGVAMLSSAIPYSLELEALRRLPEGAFGVLMSLEPAVAALVGFIGLDQGLTAQQVLAIGFVLVASAGALGTAGKAVPPEG